MLKSPAAVRGTHRKLERLAREQIAKAPHCGSANSGAQSALCPGLRFCDLNGKLSQHDIVINERSATPGPGGVISRRTRPRSYVGWPARAWIQRRPGALGLKLASAGSPHLRFILRWAAFISPRPTASIRWRIISDSRSDGRARQWRLAGGEIRVGHAGLSEGHGAETDQFQSRLSRGRQGEQRDFWGGRAFYRSAHGMKFSSHLDEPLLVLYDSSLPGYL